MQRFRLVLILSLCWMAQGWPAFAQPVPLPALTPERLGTLPQHQATLSYGNPPAPHSFQGPLLWDVLVTSAAVDPARHADTVRQWLTIRGADGYAALVALGEIAPEFENKAAILATRMDGAALATPRAVIPGDKRAGRSVRDVVGLTVENLPGASR